MELFKRKQYLAKAWMTDYAIVTDEFTTIIHVNDQDASLIDMHHIAGRHLGKGYEPVEVDEVLPIIGKIHMHTGIVINKLISPIREGVEL